ncbi:hypothetical protein ACWC10_00125 [Streptomyces sp. NPDC001595]|uniref:hypothetical protein n=1 Tax=Streptomyces sp. NPDC001532 TaxID=3154520 RepID=UPI00332BAE71
MTFGDQGTPYGQPYGHPGTVPGQPAPDPYTQWVVERERIRRRRRTRLAVAGATGVVLLAALAAGTVMYTGGSDGGTAAAPHSPTATASPVSGGPKAPSVTVSLPPDAPSALPSLLARPVVRPEQAFPATAVRLRNGSRYERVDLATTPDCAQGTSPELAALIEQGEGCVRLTAALFTDVERRSQVTVSVLSFRRVEDASSVFAMASMDPVTYQTVSLDPPPAAGMPTVPPGAAGVFRRVMTVRSVVFANGQWGDGAETEEAEITRQTEELLQYAADNVVAYEEG